MKYSDLISLCCKLFFIAQVLWLAKLIIYEKTMILTLIIMYVVISDLIIYNFGTPSCAM